MPGPAPALRPGSGLGRATLVAAVALAVFFAPALLTRGQFLFRDAGRMHWPMKAWVAGQLLHGRLPEWNPYAGLGQPVVAGAIDAVQHPFNLLLVLLPFEIAFKLWVLLSYLLAASGGFAWARAMGRSWHAALAAGLAFALSGPLVGSSDNLTYLTTLAALPWLFAAAHGWLARGGPTRLGLLGLASGLCAAGGDPQAWGFATAALPFYALLAREGGGRVRAARRGLAAAGAALAGALPVLLPVLAWLPHSSRAVPLRPLDLQLWNLPLPRLLELALPHMYRDAPGAIYSPLYAAYGGGPASPIPWVLSIYVGASVLALGLLGALRSRPARWLLVWAALLAWMALGERGGFGRLLPGLPVLRDFRYWEKMAIWPSLLVAAAAAHGLDEVLGRGTRALRFGAASAAAGALGLAVWGAGRAAPERLASLLAGRGADLPLARAFAGNLLDGLWHSAVVCLVLGLAVLAVQRGLLRRSSAPLLALVVAADPFAANLRGYTLADPAIVRPRAPLADHLRSQGGLQRIYTPFDLTRDRWLELKEFEAGWLWAARTLAPSFNVPRRVGNFASYAGMAPGRAARFERLVPAAERLPHIGVFGVGYLVVPGSPEMAARAGLAPPHEIAAADPVLPAWLVRLPHRPRAYLASELAPADEQGALDFLRAVDPARSPASVVEGPVPAGYAPPRGTARIVRDEPEEVAVETESDRQALLVLNDSCVPGWSATVDGRPAGILSVNYLARGVWVEAGRHTVAFSYRTPGLREGWILFLLGALALAAWAWHARRSPGPPREPT